MARPEARPFVSLLSDFGARDPSAGIMRSVIYGIATDAIITDISHDVAKFAVRDGALLLWCTVPYTPVGAHVAVVDPGVGTNRRSVALETQRGDFLVGPDNGLLLPAAARLGGVTRAHVLENPQYRLPIVSSSFHGRDVFAPAAAHLVMGVPIDFMGPAIDPRSLILLDWPEPEVYDGLLRTSVVYVDTFGNVKLSALGGHMVNAFANLAPGERLWIRIEDGSSSRDIGLPWVDTFGHVAPGQGLIYDDSYGRLCIAVNQGSAVRQLGIGLDFGITITRAPLPRPAAVVVAQPARPMAAPLPIPTVPVQPVPPPTNGSRPAQGPPVAPAPVATAAPAPPAAPQPQLQPQPQPQQPTAAPPRPPVPEPPAPR